jgi:serine/threonine-protein kinase
MRDLIGRTLGHYRIVDKIGEGGMGEVYRAHDERLDRDVAVKVLPEAVAEDPQRLSRFEREAKLLASLSHQNVATLHGLEDHEGQRFLVMELAEGETLAARIKNGPIPVDDALAIARQIAEGLEAAHEQGIIHRDLKPANVMVSPEGTVKVLDFGLAKAWQPEESDADITHSPTLTAQMTAAGVLLGTAAYMSPEQARGKAADRRADIWAFGVMLFEMLTGQRLFEGETTSDVLAAVLRAEPDWAELPAATPTPVVRLLHRCLERDPRERLHDIADARLEIDEAITRPEWASLQRAERQEQTFRDKVRASWPILLAAVALTALMTAGAVWRFSNTRPEAARPPTRLNLSLPPGVEFRELWHWMPTLAMSPDGRWLVFQAKEGETKQLFKRSLGQFDAVAMPGTEGGWNPFFSPDGRWVGFITEDNFLKKIPLAGGPPETLADAFNPRGATWGPDGTIVFNPVDGGGLWRVPASGGEPEQLISWQPEQGELDIRWPEFLPDGEAVLFTAWQGPTVDTAQVCVLDLVSRARKTLVENASYARYMPTGHLIFGHKGTIHAAPFDAERREATGPSVPIHEPIFYDSDQGVPQLAVSTGGTLAFIPGDGAPRRQLVSGDLEGSERPLVEAWRGYMQPRFSPEGERLAVTISEPGDTNIWVVDLRTGAQTRLTQEGTNLAPIWTPDGRRVTYFSDRGEGTSSIDWKRADGSGESESLVSSRQPGELVVPQAWSPDGKTLGYLVSLPSQPENLWDIWIATPDGDQEPRPLVASAAPDYGVAISPDGRWLAYLSVVSGRWEIFVQPFPEGGERHQVSTDGGVMPVWSPDGRSVFYVNQTPSVDFQIMRVAVSTSPRFRAGTPEVLLDEQYFTGFYAMVRYFDIAPDGKSFVFVKEDEEWGKPTEIRVVLNWFEELKRLVPAE